MSMQTLRFEPRRRRDAGVLALLLLAHGGLWWLVEGRQRPRAPETSGRSELRLIALKPPAPVAEPTRPRPRTSAPQRLAPSASIAPLPLATPSPAVVVDAEAPTTQALEPPAPREPLLGTDATRRAVRLAARNPLLSERAASAMGDGAPVGPEARLGQQILQAADGDCLKGEFAGAGMGILSLPFWMLAEARGKCRR